MSHSMLEYHTFVWTTRELKDIDWAAIEAALDDPGLPALVVRDFALDNLSPEDQDSYVDDMRENLRLLRLECEGQGQDVNFETFTLGPVWSILVDTEGLSNGWWFNDFPILEAGGFYA
jgi:hypothetical protein